MAINAFAERADAFISAPADAYAEAELVRLLLLISGFLLFLGGMLSLLTSNAIAEDKGWDLREVGIWGVVLVSIVPGIVLVFAGVMLDEARKKRTLDIAALVVSIAVFIVLTTTVMISL